jgi:pyrroloquinoline quinone biosynthesis protein B
MKPLGAHRRVPAAAGRAARVLLAALVLNPFLIARAEVSLHVLGIGQDTGYPQAGCFAPHCMDGWRGDRPRRPAVSLAVVDDEARRRYLFEATPDFPAQFYQLETLAPADRFELAGIFLTHAHMGHYTGLMYLGHEAIGASGVPVYAMPRMRGFLETNGPWSQLVAFGNIELRDLEDGRAVDLGALRVTPLRVPHRDEYSETVGFVIAGPEKRALFIPDIDKWEQWDRVLEDVLASVDYAFLDATFYADGELPGRDMSRIPHPFVVETMARLRAVPARERGKVWFIHMNHTNPVLWDDTPESAAVRAAGFRLAREGMRFGL